MKPIDDYDALGMTHRKDEPRPKRKIVSKRRFKLAAKKVFNERANLLRRLAKS